MDFIKGNQNPVHVFVAMCETGRETAEFCFKKPKSKNLFEVKVNIKFWGLNFNVEIKCKCSKEETNDARWRRRAKPGRLKMFVMIDMSKFNLLIKYFFYFIIKYYDLDHTCWPQVYCYFHNLTSRLFQFQLI